jgi:hypothetical protein
MIGARENEKRERFFLVGLVLWPVSEREAIWLFSQKETAAPEGAAVRVALTCGQITS